MSDDLISRQAAEIAFVEKGQLSRRYKLGEVWELNYEEIRDVLNDLPSVQPEQKTGRWIFEKGDGKTCVDGYICSACGRSYHTKVPYFSEFDFCPCCGAKMENKKG